MAISTTRLHYLLDQYITGRHTPEELTEFWGLIDRLEDADPIKEQIMAWWHDEEGADKLTANVDPARVLERILGDRQLAKQPVHRIHFLRMAWFRYAAMILLAVGVSVYFYYYQDPALPQQEKATVQQEIRLDDVAPGFDKAILTLSNGKQVALDETNTTVISDGGVVINKDKGELVYGKTNIVAYNTMTTPRGGQYRLTLPDGTQIWLNAASSITYPTAFVGEERKVEISGEVYFEVAKNAAMPFKVKLRDGSEIRVLGTHFNVNTYADEPSVRTTLLEGSVMINNNVVLQPGQAYSNGKVTEADTEAAVAWKNGVFIFNKDNLASVMRQLSRWYDVEVEYQGNLLSRTFSGKIKRDLGLLDLLDGLKSTDVHFKIEGKKLIVTP